LYERIRTTENADVKTAAEECVKRINLAIGLFSLPGHGEASAATARRFQQHLEGMREAYLDMGRLHVDAVAALGQRLELQRPGTSSS
jgi:hypothetical protein